MQSTKKVSLGENSDKSHSEWPSLSDVSSNNKKTYPSPSATKSVKDNKSCKNSSAEKCEEYESSKEIENPCPSTSGRGAKKKNSVKTKWSPVPITPEPYKKRGNVRHFYDSNRNFNGVRKNESSSGQENGRGSMRGNNRFRGKRGRGYSHNFRLRREESSRDEIENGSSELRYDSGCVYNDTVYYNPYSMYSSTVARRDVLRSIRFQIEYYFSHENLMMDIYTRRKMDDNGYVPISVIASYPIIRQYTTCLPTIIESLRDSTTLEIVDNKIRPLINPTKWPLPDLLIAGPGLRADVPEFYPGQPYVASLTEGMDSLNLNGADVNSGKYPQSPNYAASTSSDQVFDSMSCYSESETPPKQISDYYGEDPVNLCVTNGNGYDYCSTTPDEHVNGFNSCPDEHVNGFNSCPDEHVAGFNSCPDEHVTGFPISNFPLYCTADMRTNEQIPNGISFSYNSIPDEDLSTCIDNSAEDQQEVLKNESPEPTR